MSRDVPASDQIGYLVKRLQQLIRSALDEALSRHGVTMATYAALSSLEEAPGLSNAELARRCFVTPQTMNRIVQDLAEEGLIDRQPDPGHGRILQTTLAPQGRALLDRCHREVDAVHTRMLADLDQAEQRQLNDLLRRCIDGLET